MHAVADDIQRKIKIDFKNVDDRRMVSEKIASLFTANLNVGADQLARCILVISEGNINVLQSLFDSKFNSDPRDVISMAMEKSKNTINWGINRFL